MQFSWAKTLTKIKYVLGFNHETCEKNYFYQPNDTCVCSICKKICETHHIKLCDCRTKSIKNYSKNSITFINTFLFAFICIFFPTFPDFLSSLSLMWCVILLMSLQSRKMLNAFPLTYLDKITLPECSEEVALVHYEVWSASIWQALKCGAGGEWRR